jgi:hypothetical protein
VLEDLVQGSQGNLPILAVMRLLQDFVLQISIALGTMYNKHCVESA